jgi:uncharacterized membrane protein YccC
MTASIGRFLGLDRPGVAHGLRLAFAAWLAFAVATLLDVGNAYWAAMPVWVGAQPSRGLLLERAFFRVIGTVLGAAAGFGILRVADGGLHPALALLSAWVAVGAGLVHILGGMHGYGAMMSGMTAAIVVLPSALAPEQSWAIALSRVECTLIGVIVVTLVTGPWTPDSPRRALYRRVRHLTGDAVAFVASVLTGRLPPAEGDALERRILREMGEVQAGASLVVAGSVKGYRRLHHIDALIVASLAVMAAGRAIEQRQRRRGGEAAPGATPDDLAKLADDLRAGAAALRTAEDDRWRALLARVGRLEARLARALERLLRAEAAFGAAPGRVDDRPFSGKTAYLAPHRDGRLAAVAGLAAGGATFAAAVLGHASGWPAGPLAALGVCIFSLVLGSLPAPRAAAPLVLQGVGAGVAAAVLYRLTIQPHVTMVSGLVLSVAPFLLVGGLAQASRRIAVPALDANMAFLLASQAVLPAVTDRAVILSEAAALVLAAGLVCSGFMLMPRRAGRRAKRAAEAIRRDLRRLATRREPPAGAAGLEAVTARQVLRLGLQLGRMTDLRMPPRLSLVAVLNLGEAILRLRALATRRDLDDGARQVLSEALLGLGRMREDPVSVADAFERQASVLADGRAAEALRDAAADLRASRALLTASLK